MKQFYRLTADCSGCVVVQAYGIRFAILLLSSPLTSPGTEYLPIIVNITLPSDYFCVRCLRFHRLLYFTPDAYSHPLSKSFGKKALFVIQPTGVLAARQAIVRSEKVQRQSSQSLLLKYVSITFCSKLRDPMATMQLRFLIVFLITTIFQEVFIWIANAEKYKFYSDLWKDASKLSPLH